MMANQPKPLTITVVCVVLLTLALAACKSISARPGTEADMLSNPDTSGTSLPSVPASPSSQSQNPDDLSMASEVPSDDPLASPATTADDLLAQGYFIVDSDGNYAIYALPHERGGFEHYLYRIGAEEPYLAEEIYEGSLCAIDYVNGILRLHTGSGNMGEAQYFDVEKGKKSDAFVIESNYADYVDPVGEYYLFACIDVDLSKKGSPAYLVIKDIFTNEIISIIDRPFNLYVMPLNDLFFVSEREVYLDYDVSDVDEEYSKGNISSLQEYYDKMSSGNYTSNDITETITFR